MRILFIGDIVGRAGRDVTRRFLDSEQLDADLIVANAENAAGGVGLTREVADELFSYGIDLLTLGNHAFDKRDVLEFIDDEHRLVRPFNYPPGVPGRGFTVARARNGVPVGVINLMGRVFNILQLDCPFRTADRALAELREECRVILVDHHAEATSEKQALGYYLDGRVSAVVGTHTHVATADENILPGGTAYITDVGMVGAGCSVIGVRKELVIERFLTQLPVRFEVARGLASLSAVWLEIDSETGKALSIQRLRYSE